MLWLWGGIWVSILESFPGVMALFGGMGGQPSINSTSGNRTMVFPLGNHFLLVSMDGSDLIS